MKKFLHSGMTAMLVISFFVANAQYDWGSNKFIANNSKKCVISVAGNGWIYVLHQFGTSLSSTQNGWQLYVSEDDGWTFDLEMEQSYDSEYYYLVDVDMVASGDDASNIKVFIGEIRNTGSSGQTEGSMTIRRYMPGEMQLMYQKFHGTDHAYSISMACDFRAPGGDAIPFCVSAAWTQENTSIQTDELNYVYSNDGGDTYHYESLYAFPGIHRVSLALGRSLMLDLGFLAVAFEVNYDAQSDMGDIGVMINHLAAINNNWTEPVIVNFKHSFLIGKVSRPAISMMQTLTHDIAGHDQVPIVIAMEDHSNASNSDLAIAHFSDDYAWNGILPLVPTMDQVVIAYPYGTNSPVQEKNPHLMYDRGFNNFLMTYSTEDTEELIYTGTNVDNLLNDDWWVMGNYRSNTGDLPANPIPRVDIDLSKGKAVFAWRDNYIGFLSPAKSYVDTEWWVVGTEEHLDGPEVSVYPNPVHDRFFIKGDNNTRFSYSLCTLLGQVVLEGTSDQAETEIILPDMVNQGVYLLMVKSGNRSLSQKVLVQ
jgi:hypothetical protein